MSNCYDGYMVNNNNTLQVPRLDVEGTAVAPAGLESPLRDVHSRNSSSSTPKQVQIYLLRVKFIDFRCWGIYHAKYCGGVGGAIKKK